MRCSLALLALSLLVPSTALADDNTAAPSNPAGATAQPGPVIERELPNQAPESKPAVVHAPAPRPVAPSTAETTDDLGGYVLPHFVPYLGGDIPKYAHIETKPNMALIASGTAVLGTAYFVSLIYALSTCGAQMDCRAGSGWLYLPVVGPFITAAQSGTPGGSALAAFDGGVQTLGAALAIAGLVAPKKFVVWQDKNAAVAITPTSPGPMAAGLAVTVTNL